MKKNNPTTDHGKGIIVDIGTGNGKFVYELARQRPDHLVIGVDPSHPGLEKISRKIHKKPAKGGLKNALLVIARVEDLPLELDNIVNQVFIILPWAGLLEGLILAKPAVLTPIKRICQNGALVEIVLGYHQTSEGKQVNLPKLNKEFLVEKLAPKFETQGFSFHALQELTKNNLAQIPTNWAKRLKFGKERKFFYLQLQVKKQ